MKRLALALALFFAALAPAWAGFDEGVTAYQRGDYATAYHEFHPLARQGDAAAQNYLGLMYHQGQGVARDYAEAAKWFRLAAAQGTAGAQYILGAMYDNGQGVAQDYTEAAKWYRLAAEQGHARAQYILGLLYLQGQRVAQDYVQAHKWFNLSAANQPPGEFRDMRVRDRDRVARLMTPAQIARAQDLARNFTPRRQTAAVPPPAPARKRKLASTGSGFVVSRDGHVLTNAHVIEGCAEVHTKPAGGTAARAKIIARDGRGDLALLKAAASSAVASFREGKRIRQGEAVVAIGYPLHGLLASGASLSTGTVSALSGLRDDARHLQITAPIQPGNSGGPLLDASGNVVGVVVAKLDALMVAGVTGDIPQNVNFAIKAELATGFLLAHGILAETAPSSIERTPADIGDAAKRFTLIIECWK